MGVALILCTTDKVKRKLIYFPRIQFEILNIFEMFFIRRHKNSITGNRHGGNHGIHFSGWFTDLPKVMLDDFVKSQKTPLLSF